MDQAAMDNCRSILRGLGWLSYCAAVAVLLTMIFAPAWVGGFLEGAAAIVGFVASGALLHAAGHILGALLSIEASARTIAERDGEGGATRPGPSR